MLPEGFPFHQFSDSPIACPMMIRMSFIGIQVNIFKLVFYEVATVGQTLAENYIYNICDDLEGYSKKNVHNVINYYLIYYNSWNPYACLYFLKKRTASLTHDHSIKS